ncbi:MAG: ketosteroid isomerase-related protein [Amycolatopsis sp.]|jgi:ketosteroid isomerase-like protein|uniref:nuclear transport factor 2 family protein n=1 Tax=Amycolatopsis sp. TaxID=37632 RepID=UPI002626CC76|nr:nuclear transport factor 2 family protein [Amycolatopsis sp.]MCU1682013.1 ketosteroid isomerase-related protein [Amycolatopsis sp.]
MSTPREVFQQLVDGMVGKKWEQLPELFAEDVVVFHPLSTGPEARIEGREKVREHFARMAGFDADLQIDDIVVYETTDPEVVVCEQTMRTSFGGKEVSMPGIRVMRVRDGLIVSSRDYGNRQGS